MRAQAEEQIAVCRAALAGAPVDLREAEVGVKDAAHIAGRDPDTVRRWAQRYGIGRQIGGTHGEWKISVPRLNAHLRTIGRAVNAA